MRKLLMLSVTALAMSGCVDDDQFMLETSRSVAKRVITPIMADKFPGRNTAAYTDCVIDNATTDEIIGIAEDAVTGVDSETVGTVLRIASRSGSLRCFASVELGVPL